MSNPFLFSPPFPSLVSSFFFKINGLLDEQVPHIILLVMGQRSYFLEDFEVHRSGILPMFEF
jgi:hypothetical protein